MNQRCQTHAFAGPRRSSVPLVARTAPATARPSVVPKHLFFCGISFRNASEPRPLAASHAGGVRTAGGASRRAPRSTRVRLPLTDPAEVKVNMEQALTDLAGALDAAAQQHGCLQGRTLPPDAQAATLALAGRVADGIRKLCCRRNHVPDATRAIARLHDVLAPRGVAFSRVMDVQALLLHLSRIGRHTVDVAETLCTRLPVEERAAAYSTAVVEHARRGAARAVERLWGSFNAQRDARGQPLVPDRSMVTAVVHMYGHRGCLDVANDLLMQYLSVCQTRGVQPSPGPVNALMNAMCEKGDPRTALGLYCEHFGSLAPLPLADSSAADSTPLAPCPVSFAPADSSAAPVASAAPAAPGPAALQADQVTMNVAAKAAMACVSVEVAAWVNAELHRWGLPGDESFYISLIKACERAGDVGAALGVRAWAETRGAPLGPPVWAALVMAAGRAGLMEKAFGLWREMEEAGLRPRQPQFHALLIACAACHRADRAMEVVRAMRAAGVPRTDVTYSLAVNACHPGAEGRASASHVAAADAMLAMMRDDLPRQRPTLRIATALMTLFGDAGMPRRALRVFADLRAGRPDATDGTAFSRAIRACTGHPGLAQDAFGLYLESQRLGVRDTRELYLSALRVCREAGMVEEALQVYRDLRGAGFPPDNHEFRKLLALCAERAMGAGQRGKEPGGAEDEAGEGGHEQQGPLLSLDQRGAREAEAGAGHAPPLLEHAELGLSLETIDLHGVSTVEARAGVLLVLRSLLRRWHTGRHPRGGLTIVTGSGRHSESEPKLQVVVASLLQELGLPADSPSRNPGRLTVRQEDLAAWLGRSKHGLTG